MREHLLILTIVMCASAQPFTQQAPPPRLRTLVWLDRTGTEQPLDVKPQLYTNPRVSPDGRTLAITAGAANAEHIWTCSLPACATFTQFTKQGTTNDIAVWTPDGSRLGFYSNMQGGPAAAYLQMADGSGVPERMTGPIPGIAQHVRAFSPNGQFALMYHATPATQSDIWLLRMSDRLEFPFLATPAIEGGARYSPDGNWIAYMSTESGGPQIYVQEMPGDRRKRQVSTEGGVQPLWHPKGGELYYRVGSRLMAVPITAAAELTVGQPRVVSDRNYWMAPTGLTNQNYDIAPDGQRFLMIKELP